jgi:hypothetical protein
VHAVTHRHFGERAGTGEISFDLPTDLFAAFDGDDIAAVGREFNGALRRVLTLLGLESPAELAVS